MRRVTAVLLTFAVLGAACSESAVTEGTVEAADSAADSDASSGTVSDLAPEDWSEATTTAWADMLTSRSRAASIAIEGLSTGDHRLDWTQTFLVEDRAALEEALAELPGEPSVATLVEPYRSLISSLESLLAASDELHALGESDPDAVRAEIDAVGEDLPSSEYGALYIAVGELDGPLADACFSLQAAMTDEGLDLLDCTGAGVDQDEAQDGVGTDNPTDEATGGMTDVLLDPGRHDFSVFRPGFVIETTTPLLVSTTDRSISFSPEDDPEPEILITDTLSLVDPDSFADDRFLTDSAYGPVETDLGTWLEQLPLSIAGSGSMASGEREFPYWDVVFDPEAGVEELILVVYSGSLDSDGFAEVLPLLPDIELTMRVVEWDRGDDRLLVAWYFTDDGAVYEEFFVDVMSGVQGLN